jgi:hypothetical protein
MKPIYDSKDTTSRGLQIADSIRTKLDEAAIAKAKAGPTADERRLAKTLEGLTVPMPQAKR